MASEHWGLWLAALLGLIGFGGLVALDVEHGSLRGAQVPSTIGWYLVAFAGYVVAVWWNEGHGIPWRWLWLIPVVFRLLMLSTAPTLSDDVHRYLWDGHLVSQGVNPYANVIDDPALDPYTIDAREEADNPQLSSPYLPTAHAVFGAVALVLPSEPWTMQLAMTLFDLAAAALLAILLPRVGLDRSRVLVYLWNPLVIVEIAHGAHLDALMVALTLGSLVLTLDPRGGGRRAARIGAPLLLALATLTRPIPALLLPVLFWRWSWPQRLLYGVTCVVVVVPFGLRPGFGLVGEPEGTGVFGSARVYAETFRFNSSIYHWFEQWVLGRGLDDRGWNEPLALTRLVLGASVAGVLLAVWWFGRGVTDSLATLDGSLGHLQAPSLGITNIRTL